MLLFVWDEARSVESVDRDEKDNLIERTTGYLNRQIERRCIVIQGSEKRRRTSNNTPFVLIIFLVEAGVRRCWHSRGYFQQDHPSRLPWKGRGL